MNRVRVFEVLRANETIKKANGENFHFTPNDLIGAANSYNVAKRVASLTIGHPNDDEPRLGEVSAVFYDDGKLSVVGNFSDELIDKIKCEGYRNRSASLFRPDSPGNPSPGEWYLKHVGFLDANTRPAVPGLLPVEFSENVSGVVNFSDYQEPCSFYNINYSSRTHIRLTQPDGSVEYGFIHRGNVLKLHKVL
ncbi:hypothetical protein LZ92_19270 [Salmonella enterica]|nr:hypothetical protein [Salmonella enterica subsp. enterica serovar Newport]EBP1502407.1 hypothetical protein [Salmonella enterica]